jgi:hypothetical protein
MQIDKLKITITEKFPESKKEIFNKLSKIPYSHLNSMYKDIRGTKNELGEYWYNLTQKYANDVLKDNLKHTSIYTFAKGEDSGRMNSPITNIFREMRTLLFDGVGYDVDMINCCCSLLYYLCKKHDLQCKQLKKYIKYREKYLKETCISFNIDRSEAKLQFIRCLHDDKFYKFKNFKKGFIFDFDFEIKELHNSLCKLYPDLCSSVKKKKSMKGEKNYIGAFMCRLLRNLESDILRECIIQIHEQFPDSWFALFFDGFIVNNEIPKNDVIDICNKVTKKYCVKWAVKDFDYSLVEKFDEYELPDSGIYHDHCGDNWKDLTDYILKEMFPKEKLFKSEESIYLKSGFRYIVENIKNTTLINEIIYNEITDGDLYYNSKNEKGNLFEHPVSNGSVKVRNEFTKDVIARCRRDDDFHTKLFNKSIGKILYRNGEYNFETGHFETNPNKIFSKNMANIEFTPSVPKYRKELMEKIIYPVFTLDAKNPKKDINRYNLMRCNLRRLSRATAGKYEDKAFVIWEGEPNSGKSALFELAGNTYGDGYVVNFNISNFIRNRNNGQDVKRQLAWLFDVEFARIMFSSEVDNSEGKTLYVDGGLIKRTIASGGEAVQARQNFKDGRSVKSQATWFALLNQMFNCSPTDVLGRCEYTHLISKFIDNHETKEYSNIIYYPKDHKLKEIFLTRPEIQNEFANLLHEAYNYDVEIPKVYLREKEDMLRYDVADEEKTILDEFEFTGKHEDYITVVNIKKIINKHNFSFSTNKISRRLLGKGAFVGDDNNGLPKQKNKKNVYYGVKEKDLFTDDD